MLRAYNHHQDHPDQNLYVLFAQGVKFQYPPSSLLLVELLPASWRVATDDRVLNNDLLRLLNWLSRLAVVGTWLVAAGLILLTRNRLARSVKPLTDVDRALIFMLALPLAATFYPNLNAYRLGQVQVFLNLAVGVALFSFLSERRALAGALLAACTLVKPQYGLVLLWSIWRREKRFSVGYALCLGLGIAASVWRFGLSNQLAYLDVLREIGRLGESAYLNQSVNGLLNRWVGNGVVVPTPGALQSNFAPYHPGIYLATTVSSAVIVLLSFEPWKWRRDSAGVLDLAVVLAGSTMAAPVAWNHHYGIFLHIFAIALPLIAYSRRNVALGVLLGASFLLIGFEFVKVEWFIQTPGRMLLFSHVFFGALVLFALMLRLRRAKATNEASAHYTALVQP
jgi:alpha-1,2-mannosyltransferase